MVFRLLIAFSFSLFGCWKLTNWFSDPPKMNIFLEDGEHCDLKLDDGSCLVYQKEIFEISEIQPLKLIFILDVTPSMNPFLQQIGGELSPLLQDITSFSVDMAFTTADHGDHQFYCDKDQWNAEGTDCALGFARQFPKRADRWEDYKGDRPYFGRFMSLQDQDGKILPRQILSSHTPNYEQIFYHTITRHFDFEVSHPCDYPPYCQQGDNEQPLRVLKSIFSQAHSINRHFFDEEDVSIAVFIMTNERERAEDFNRATTSQDVLDEFSRVFHKNNTRRQLFVYGISIQTIECLQSQQNTISASADYSQHLSELVKATGGINVNICDSHYARSFSEISEHIYKKITSLPLEHTPMIHEEEDIGVDIVLTTLKNEKLQVKWKGEVLGRSISFSEDILPGSQVEVKYYYKR